MSKVPLDSIAAQREACEAFILSQRHEGWRVLEAHYDDGGYSGGTLERPALKRLLDDIAAGKLDCVVVYKVDRLTRALTDFAKIVEAFDAKGIALVSVTQQFNTTSSMGRLTLNVLLSFAQFERELTAERVRDKFAASKRKGLWMGERVPLGYELKERQLIVNEREAALVCSFYQRYLELGCVSKLRAELITRGIVSKRRLSRRGSISGGVAYSRGALYALLKNRLYVGKIAYRGDIYPGNHERLIERALWERVQQHLGTKRKARREGERGRAPSLLLCSFYQRYLELGCVSKLRAELITRGIVSKRRLSRRGSISGGVAYSRGALYALLKLMAERGIVVTYETIRRWCQKFGRAYARQLRSKRGRLGDTWHLDEVFLRINGKLQYLWRAVDQDGEVLDILVQPKRDKRAAKRFFRKLLKGLCCAPRRPNPLIATRFP